jgi:type IV pilus assembly protein PilW
MINYLISPMHMRKCRPVTPYRTAQTGFTLIELMVSIAIALFIAAGLTLMVINMRTTFSSQDKMSQVQDSQRLAVAMLTTSVQSSGYFIDLTQNTAAVALPASTSANPNGTFFVAGQIISGTSGTSGASDTVDVRYQTESGDGLMNCQGVSNTAPTPAPTPATPTPTKVRIIWVNSFAVNASNELTCAVNGGAAVPLVSNVASMTILYGVDTNSDGNVDTYLNASAVTAAGRWDRVQTAQFRLSFVNLMDSRPGAVVALPQLWIQTISLQNNI